MFYYGCGVEIGGHVDSWNLRIRMGDSGGAFAGDGVFMVKSNGLALSIGALGTLQLIVVYL